VAPLDEASPDVLVHLLELDDRLDPELVGQWIDVYELVTAGAVRLAVERAGDAEIAHARRLLARFADPSMSDPQYLRTTDELAEVISAASRNLVLRMVRSTLRALFFQRYPTRRRARLRPPPEVLAPIAAQLDQALGRRDAPAAEEGVRRLLRTGRESLLKALEARAARPA
jgi:DNA-binding FadR family transcriptional regulator